MPDHPSDAWAAPHAAEPIDAIVSLPGSKSLTNRYLVVSALAQESSRIRRPLRSRDTLLMADALRTLGVRISDVPGGQEEDWLVEPVVLQPAAGGAQEVRRIDCGLAGTVMRFLPPVAALTSGSTVFDGDEHARTRPMGAMLEALRTLGVDVDALTDTMPFTISGTGAVAGGEVVIDASASSQFVSGLLLSGCRFNEGLTVVHDGKPVPSEPHIAMTVEVLRDAGVVVDDSEPNRWRVEPGDIYGLDVAVEPDLSNAAAFLAAAMVTGGRVQVPSWPQHTTQAGDGIRDIFDAMGGQVHLSREGLTVTGPSRPTGLDVDLHDVGELTPVVAAVAALADSPSWLRGIAHLRGHETDRLAALATEITRLGGAVEVFDDGLHIMPAALRPARLATYGDHRMAMAAAILGLVVPGVTIEDIATTGKTMPDFAHRWTAMVTGDREDQ